jgi:hypothetical protein
VRRLALIALIESCSFAPPASSFTDRAPEKDGAIDLDAEPELDAGLDAGQPNDGGPPRDGGDNRAPMANAGPAQRGIPWDTFALDGTASLDPDGDPLAFRWSIESAPVGALGGFAPFPGAAIAEVASTSFYAERAGTYLLKLEVSDGSLTDSATVAIEIDGFHLLPSPPGLAPGDTVALAIEDDRVYLGVKPRGGEIYELATRTSRPLPCEVSDKINAIAIDGDARAYYVFDDSRVVISTDGASCESLELPEGPSKIKDVEVGPSGELYFATDRDVYSAVADQISEHVFAALGNDAKYRALGIADGPTLWIGTDEASGNDGAIATSIPPDESAPVTSWFGGDDKVTAIAAGVRDEVWIAGELGIAHVADVRTPAVAELHLDFPPPLTVVMLAAARDPRSDDLFFANAQGIARYKRDVGAFVVIAKTTSGLGAGDLRTLAFDRTRRILVVGTQSGAFMIGP